MGPAPRLRDAYEGVFHVGALINKKGFAEPGRKTLDMVAEQFNTVSSENVLKWKPFHPDRRPYRPQEADLFKKHRE